MHFGNFFEEKKIAQKCEIETNRDMPRLNFRLRRLGSFKQIFLFIPDSLRAFLILDNISSHFRLLSPPPALLVSLSLSLSCSHTISIASFLSHAIQQTHTPMNTHPHNAQTHTRATHTSANTMGRCHLNNAHKYPYCQPWKFQWPVIFGRNFCS